MAARLTLAMAAMSREVVPARPLDATHRRVALSRRARVSIIRTYDTLSSMAGSDEGLGVAGAAGFVVAVGAFVVAAGLALGGLRFVGGTPPERGVEGAIGSLALGAVVAAPGVPAMLAVSERPVPLFALPR